MRNSKVILTGFTIILIAATTGFFHATQRHYIHFSEGKVLLKKEEYERARESFLKALAVHPTDIRTIQYILVTDRQLNDDSGSDVIYQLLAGQTEKDGRLTLYVADHFYSREYFNKAEMLYKNTADREERFSVELKLAEVLLWQKKNNEAIVLLQDLYDKNDRHQKVILYLANAYLWSQQPGLALPYYEILVAQGVTDEEVIINYADALRYAGKHEKAVQVYDQYLKDYETE